MPFSQSEKASPEDTIIDPLEALRRTLDSVATQVFEMHSQMRVEIPRMRLVGEQQREHERRIIRLEGIASRLEDVAERLEKLLPPE